MRLPHPGPLVLYSTYVNTLSMEFFIFAALLIAGRRAEEDIMRRSALLSMCFVIISDVAWTNLHPKPVSLRIAAAAAGGSVLAQGMNLAIAFGVVPSLEYSSALAGPLLVAAGLCWIVVGQFGTDYVVTTNRSPARYLQLAWITVMVAGSSLSLIGWLRNAPGFLVFLALLPRLLSFVWLMAASLLSFQQEQTDTVHAGKVTEELTLAIPRAANFLVFAFTSVYGEAFNDITTDLTVRRALSAGDSTLQLSYNGAVLASMCCGLVTETLAAGAASRTFAALWGLCQLMRCAGIGFLSPENWQLMFAFCFFDKLTGPLGSAAMDVALLALIRRDGGGSAPSRWPRIPANGIWTLRYPAEMLQRTSCQMLLLRTGGSMPIWVSMSFTTLSVAFVFHSLRPAAKRDLKKVN